MRGANQYKWTRTHGLDPTSGEQVALSNPRQDLWAEHFAWSTDGTEVVGLTSCGRTTIRILRLNNALAVTVRKNWIRAGWHPPEV